MSKQKKSPGPTTAALPKPAKPTDTPPKSAIVVQLLTRPDGATLQQMMDATGWQQHSVRGFMAGALKKKRGLTVTSVKTDAGRIYRIEAAGAQS